MGRGHKTRRRRDPRRPPLLSEEEAVNIIFFQFFQIFLAPLSIPYKKPRGRKILLFCPQKFHRQIIRLHFPQVTLWDAHQFTFAGFQQFTFAGIFEFLNSTYIRGSRSQPIFGSGLLKIDPDPKYPES